LIEFTPKSNLPSSGKLFKIEEFTNGGFKEIIDDGLRIPIMREKFYSQVVKIYFDFI
jgi:hypothetical protein